MKICQEMIGDELEEILEGVVTQQRLSHSSSEDTAMDLNRSDIFPSNASGLVMTPASYLDAVRKTPRSSKSFAGSLYNTPYASIGQSSYIDRQSEAMTPLNRTPFTPNDSEAASQVIKKRNRLPFTFQENVMRLAKIDWSVYGFSQEKGSSEGSSIDFTSLCELVGRDDMNRIASLQWLFLDDSYALTAIHQIHSMIQQLFYESNGEKLIQIEIILASYIVPIGSKSDLFACLQVKLEDVAMSIQSRSSEDAMTVADKESSIREETQLLQQSFDVELNTSILWRSFIRAMEVTVEHILTSSLLSIDYLVSYNLSKSTQIP